MNKFYGFGSIEQYRNFVKDTQKYYPNKKLMLQGTVKVHGTNASVVVKPNGESYTQNKSRILSLKHDNMGFAAWHQSKAELFVRYAAMQRDIFKFKDADVIIYGEWAGKNIQKGVAVNEAQRFFYLFKVRLISEERIITNHPPIILAGDPRIVTAGDIWYKELIFDSANPSSIVPQLEKYTKEVEEMCPVGAHFGFEGAGEGVVWACVDANMAFKVKGEKHSVTKVKTIVAIDPVKLASIAKFVEYAVTTNRLEQGFLEVCNNNADRKLLGNFLIWLNKDIIKEESDVLAKNDLCMKDVNKAVSVKGRNWFFNKELY